MNMPNTSCGIELSAGDDADHDETFVCCGSDILCTPRMETTMNDVLGIGYEGRDLAGFVAEVVEAGIEVVVDVRLTPISRKTGFSKRALAEALAGVGVSYQHERALGNPKPNRAGFAGSAEERAEARRRYEQVLSEPAGQASLTRVAAVAATSRAAVVCFEADQERCHRDIVLSHLTGPAANSSCEEERGE